MHLWGETLTIGSAVLLFLALALALAFEFVNGFHDTANAVATLIYTHSLQPTNLAVVWSGLWNLIGVLTSSGAVAYAVVSLLPIDLIINIGSGVGCAMVFALLLSAIVWNLGTWYFGLPASSSHTLIGSIIGVGLVYSMIKPGLLFGDGVNWAAAKNVGLALIISPLIGFCCAALLLLLSKVLIKRPDLYVAPKKDKAPPMWIRCILILTCTGVSFSHGSNDGQKGMGLLMLILIGIIPGAFALRMDTSVAEIQRIAAESHAVSAVLQQNANSPTPSAANVLSIYIKSSTPATDVPYAAMATLNQVIGDKLSSVNAFGEFTESDRRTIRTDIFLVDGSLSKLLTSKQVTDPAIETLYRSYSSDLEKLTKYIPDWVKFAVAIALGLGTMIGWKRVVVTVGEKIGKAHLTYAQGASAEIVAMITIGAANQFGLPVSTTHVLSSGVAGTMFANRSGLQTHTLRNLLLAWVLTLPVCIFLGATLFSAGLFIVLKVL